MNINGIYFAILQEDVNKFNPGIAPFTLCGLMTNAGQISTPTVTTVSNNTSGIISDSTRLGIDKISVSNFINIAIPKEHVIYYEKKIVPKGTVFIVTFFQDDASKPIILGRDIYGYYK